MSLSPFFDAFTHEGLRAELQTPSATLVIEFPFSGKKYRETSLAGQGRMVKKIIGL